MIKISNYISASTVRLIALFAIKVSPSFRRKISAIKDEVENVNKQQIHLPENLIRSVVEIEDKRYFQHSGIDVYSIMRAIFKNASTNRIEGASTIVQQLVRNIIEEREIKVVRKIKEIMLATLIDKEFSKTEMIFAYLETYRFGNCTGLSNLCRNENYDINSLSRTDSAQIAARLKYPTVNKSNYIKYLKRVRTIEKITLNTGFTSGGVIPFRPSWDRLSKLGALRFVSSSVLVDPAYSRDAPNPPEVKARKRYK